MKKEYFTIPNLMGYFRILLIPVFCVLYYHSENAGCFYGAVIVLCLSFLSDFFDGKIARHFHQVTEWGKMLDPIADKLTQAALAIMCTVHFPATIWLFLLFAAKEIYMGLMGEKSGFWCQAVCKNWYGRLGFWDFSTYFIPRHASFSIEFVDSGIDDFNGCYLDFVSSVPYRITHR